MGMYSSDITLYSIAEETNSIWFVNIRSMRSYQQAVDNFEIPSSDLQSALEGNPMANTNMPYDEWDRSTGQREEILEWHDKMNSAYKKILHLDAGTWNSLHYLDSIFTNFLNKTDAMAIAFDNNDFTSNEFNEVLTRIKGDPEFGKLTLVSLNRDQLMLNKSLYDSLSVANREYPYLPATKAVMTNQAKNLATAATFGSLVETRLSGRKRIFAVGLPAGLVETMRNKAIDEKDDISYRRSNIISIKVWRRNLLNEAEQVPPKEFFFDMSKFIIEGRATPTEVASGLLDSADGWSEGQDNIDLSRNIVIRGYSPEGQDSITQGWLSFLQQLGLTLNNVTDGLDSSVFHNHVLDFYLKLYMMLTTGVDVFEDIFPFLESEVMFTGPDEGLEEIFELMKRQMGEMFPTRDVTSAINYDRLVGEITRSILLSPKKWRNRVIYPKIFDRVFCIIIDEQEDFDTRSWHERVADLGPNIPDDAVVLDPVDGTPQFVNATATNVAISREDELRDPTYYQFYVTVTLHPPAD